LGSEKIGVYARGGTAGAKRDGMVFLYVVDVCVMNTPTTGWEVAYTQILELLFVYFILLIGYLVFGTT
jgi:hypothetical protein